MTDEFAIGIGSLRTENNSSYPSHDISNARVQPEMYNPSANSSETLAQQREIGELLGDDSAGSSHVNGNNAEVADVTMDEDNTSMDAESSAQQLRSFAQGALLNLAPHNIRFDELVEEGIDPLVLKSLYDDIGIKVAWTSGEKRASSRSPLTVPADQEPGFTEDVSKLVVSSVEPEGRRQKTTRNSSNAIAEVDVPPTTERQQSFNSFERGANVASEATGKPLERKDLIARMLAAKVSKPAQSDSLTDMPPSQSKEQTEQSGQPVIVPESATNDEDSSNLPTASGDFRTKEINRAQTELARQRMEQLKKEGLRRSQIRAMDSGRTSVSTSTDLENGTSQQSTALRHPLPDRPPEPDKTATTRIPGLFMADPEPSQAEGPSATDGTSMDQPSAATRAPRKRPRASDFTDDVPELPPKKPTPQGKGAPSSDHRVVIDISDDDESMYGSDDGHVATSRKLDPEPATSGLPIRSQPRVPSTDGYSNASAMSSLPQNPRQKEHLQTEIQNLRQEIAERERRLNEKAVSSQVQTVAAAGEDGPPEFTEHRSETPHPHVPPEQELSYGTERTTKSPLAVIEGSEKDTAVTADSPAIGSDLALRQSSLSRSGTDPNKMEDLRLKFLRKKEIESGLPILEAELTKSEAKLAQFKEEEKRLLAEIEKGKAGRLKLVQELQALGVETKGLTIEELQSTKDAIENDVTVANDTTGEQRTPT